MPGFVEAVNVLAIGDPLTANASADPIPYGSSATISGTLAAGPGIVTLYSHEAGVAKPDPRAFLLLCDELGVRPDELAFLDDVPGHIDAARALGIHGIVHVSTPASIAAIEDLLGQGS